MLDYNRNLPTEIVAEGCRYELCQEKPLGAGGMGQVFLYKDLTLGRLVAIKYLSDPPLGREKEWEHRLREEAMVPAKMASPYVISIHSCGEYKGRVYVVMEYLPQARTLGEELDGAFDQAEEVEAKRNSDSWKYYEISEEGEVEDAEEEPNAQEDCQKAPEEEEAAEDIAAEEEEENTIAEEEEEAEDTAAEEDTAPEGKSGAAEAQPIKDFGLPLEDLLNYLEQSLLALQALHSQPDRYHRDIKPANLLLYCQEGGATALKLIDFGYMRVPESKLTQYGSPIGTPAYMAPEYWSKKAIVDSRSDLYSLGVTFYEALTGWHPYPEVGDFNDAQKYHTSNVKIDTAPSDIRPKIPEELDAIIFKLMAKLPKDRYQSADEALADLAELRSSWRVFPTTAPAKNKRLMVAMVALMLLLASGVALLLERYVHSQKQLLKARAEIQLLEESLLPPPLLTAERLPEMVPEPPKESCPVCPKVKELRIAPKKKNLAKKNPRKKGPPKKKVVYRRFFTPGYTVKAYSEEDEPSKDKPGITIPADRKVQ